MGFDGDISAMGRLADRVADLSEVPSRASKRVAFKLESFLEEEFDDGADPYGTPWAPLAESTLERGRRPPPLTDSHAMRDDARVRPLRGAGVAMTVDAAYAPPHQTGWANAPARPILPARAELPRRWAEAIKSAVSDAMRGAR
jgi:hypothetical protein